MLTNAGRFSLHLGLKVGLKMTRETTLVTKIRYDGYSQEEQKWKEVQVRTKDSKSTAFLVMTTLACVLGSSVQFGFNIAAINTPKEAIETYFMSNGAPISRIMWAAIVGVFAQGGAVGALLGPLFADRIGRKRTLLINNVNAVAAAATVFLSYRFVSTPLLLFARVLSGLCCGVNAVVAPCYLSEAAPVHLRGTLGVFSNLGITLGIFFSQIFGIRKLLGKPTLWPFLFGCTLLPSFFQVAVLPFCPESPKFLFLTKGDKDSAIEALKKFHGKNNYKKDLKVIEREHRRAQEEKKFGIIDFFKARYLRMPLLISIMMQFANQATGINAVVGYSTAIFKDAGISNSDLATCGLGAVTVLVPALTYRTVETHGRRKMLIFGLAGMAMSYIILTVCLILQRSHGIGGAKYVSVVCVLTTMATYQCGPAPIPWFIVGELFCQRSRGSAFCLAGFVNWMLTFAVLMGYPLLEAAIGPFSFLLFTLFALLLIVFVYFLVPETKGKTIAEIVQYFEKKASTANSAGGEHNDWRLTFSLCIIWLACFCGGAMNFGFHLGRLVSFQQGSWRHDSQGKTANIKENLKLVTLVFFIGCIFGGFGSMKLVEGIRKRKTLVVTCLFGFAGALIDTALYGTNHGMMGLYFSSFLYGISSAGGAVVSPLYLSDVSSKRSQGRAFTTHYVGVVVGVLIAQGTQKSEVSGLFDTLSAGCVVGLSLTVIGMFAASFAAEDTQDIQRNRMHWYSPNIFGKVWKKVCYSERNTEETAVLSKIGRTLPNHQNSAESNGSSRWKFLLHSSLLSLASQLTGVGMMYGYYFILSTDGVAVEPSWLVLTTFLLVTMATMTLYIRLERRHSNKSLFLMGLFGLSTSYIALAVGTSFQDRWVTSWPIYFSYACVILSAVFQQLGPGQLAWTYPASLSKSQRTISMTVAVMAQLTVWYLLGLTLPFFQNWLKPFLSLLFAAVSVLLLQYGIFCFPDNNCTPCQDDFQVSQRRAWTVLMEESDALNYDHVEKETVV